MPAMTHRIDEKTIENAARLALDEAKLASESGSFGVGACLVGRDGTVFSRARNRVAGGESKHDPTAHAERRLIDWYYAKRAEGRDLPAESDLIVVGTVEPCMMCAGALLSSGMLSVSLCEDAAAGVAIARDFACLPPALRPKARNAIMLAGRSEHGASPLMQAYAIEAEALFAQTLARVRANVSHDVIHPATNVRFGIQSDWHDVVLERPAGVDQVAAIRVGGAEPLMPHGREASSPIGYPVLELIRTITRRGVSGLTADAERATLQFVISGAFESPAAIVTSLGAIGSFAEGPVTRTPYVMMCDVSDEDYAAVQQAISLFPPLYRETIGVTVGRIASSS